MNQQLGIRKQDGFIALMSVIIIMAILLVIGASISLTSFNSRFNVSDSEYKKRSSALAEACVGAELLQLAQGSTYANNSVVNVSGTDNCTMVSAATTTTISTVKTQGVFPPTGSFKAFTNITVVASTTGLSIISWSESPN
jgi:hypothetical protein